MYGVKSRSGHDRSQSYLAGRPGTLPGQQASTAKFPVTKQGDIQPCWQRSNPFTKVEISVESCWNYAEVLFWTQDVQILLNCPNLFLSRRVQRLSKSPGPVQWQFRKTSTYWMVQHLFCPQFNLLVDHFLKCMVVKAFCVFDDLGFWPKEDEFLRNGLYSSDKLCLCCVWCSRRGGAVK